MLLTFACRKRMGNELKSEKLYIKILNIYMYVYNASV